MCMCGWLCGFLLFTFFLSFLCCLLFFLCLPFFLMFVRPFCPTPVQWVQVRNCSADLFISQQRGFILWYSLGRCVFVEDWVLLSCSSSAGLVWERSGDVRLRPSARYSAFGSDYRIVAPPGLRAYGTWVHKTGNFLLVSGRFGWVGLLASIGGSPFVFSLCRSACRT